MWQTISNNFVIGLSIFFVLIGCLYIFQIHRNSSNFTENYLINNFNERQFFISDTSKCYYSYFNNSYQVFNVDSILKIYITNYKSFVLVACLTAMTALILWKQKFFKSGLDSLEDERKLLRLIDCIEDSLRRKYDFCQIKTMEVEDKERLFLSYNSNDFHDFDNISNNCFSDHEKLIIRNDTRESYCKNIYQRNISSSKISTAKSVDQSNSTYNTNSNTMDNNQTQDDCIMFAIDNSQLVSYNNNNYIEDVKVGKQTLVLEHSDYLIDNAHKIDRIICSNDEQNFDIKSQSDFHANKFASPNSPICRLPNHLNMVTDLEWPDAALGNSPTHENAISDIEIGSYLEEGALIEDTAQCFSGEIKKLWPKVVQVIAEREPSISKKKKVPTATLR